MMGTKHDEGKPPLGLLSRTAIEEVGRVLEHGRARYGPHNWRKGIGHQRLISAALRHIFAWNEGEDDDESGCSHLAHAICMLLFALEEHELRPALDDRWKPRAEDKEILHRMIPDLAFGYENRRWTRKEETDGISQ